MKNEIYRRAFDHLNVPSDMAERIRCAAAAEEAKDANRAENTPAAVNLPRRNFRRVRRAAAACACAAALGILVWQAGILPRRADRTASPSLDSGSYRSEAPSKSGGERSETPFSGESGTDSGKTAVQTPDAAKDGSGEKTQAKTARKTPAETPWEGKASAGGGSGVTGPETPDSTSNSDFTGTPDVPNSVTETIGAMKPNGVQESNPVEVVSSPAELAAKLSFTPSLPAAVPDGWQVLSCAAIGGTLAQIVYTGGDGKGEVCWRTAPGADDVSGDSTEYSETASISGAAAKGDNGTVSAASWTADGASFSLTFSPAVSPDAAEIWIAAVKG